MSALKASVFLKVALKEGQSIREIASAVDASPSTVSRLLLDMGQVDRNGDPGNGLIEVRRDPLNSTISRQFLTAKGRQLRQDIARIVDGEAATGMSSPLSVGP
ncbi:MarR family winged helix-turn-helix transcriptional regulator [Novosphingobium sp. G106]|uniref:MarR family winged helix-turn-helix transcriptional regulator n=1 Tax=Novosphingobium sp. G106 TaxID=2849500 RepID=UPI001C2D724F|nr:MarR family winged helix-turn-helix transcriptional regulator [Novosphingobium sp. G106]MBV1690856.1 MarR family winged helix-turn-helix transcriptional regulator [Novosphingobium sp. G106]